MIFTVVADVENDMGLAGIAAVALFGAGLTQAIAGSAFGLNPVNKGSLDISCTTDNGPRVRAAFIRAGFTTTQVVAAPVIAPKTNLVTVTTGPENKQYLQMADPACDALCGAGLTVEYPDGRSYSGDLSNDATLQAQCDGADAATVRNAFTAVWNFLANG